MRPHANLDVVRACAVLCVLAAHVASLAGSPVVYGYDLRWLGVFGVYLFFVHTCLVLMWSLERRPGTFAFYLRRIFRIYPLAIFTILLIVVFHIHYMYDPLPLAKGRVLSNLLLIQNIWPHRDLMGTLWSLPLEVDMYLLLPVFFAFAQKQSSLWAMLVIWMFACLFNYATYGPLAGNALYMVVPHFLPGVIAYVGFRTRPARLPAWGLALSLATVTILFMLSPGVRKGWFACLFIGLLLPLFRDTRVRLIQVCAHRVATYSYGIYLLHFICLWFFLKITAGHSLWLGITAGLVATGAAAAAAYSFIEEPMIRLGSRLASYLEQRREPALSNRDLNLEVAP